ncbi:uracil-DNA glycosylase family protein [Weissella paramesenteroides]|jgi:uracil-DNA glycosylase|uniref:Uracil-DNA glycosylase, family 4 n=1 Tax=Weissella paramesenteroides ATCC 33313 TaxID=585506 RepID=C5R8Q0_WEIPA|nr:uracil-DNA glycosylase family protein [Weissella paramesenteroides]ATF40668.1 uracil-DNA glycosylase [Weissella paramesenteroides]EER75544.1 uracil-DNA glycosylase, family 4 [Weissella paramesenteroides ATCC 33313]KAA8442104.1 uracil-DNA glycosylase family protein [Weissella paramesenteroides]KAA8442348.1 uracil-DNA glycosylase family protein [Weissella paramesenteroides]KAA8443742.1 uracil-DNA glycosylase family protein [Weissella paramesenteroides]
MSDFLDIKQAIMADEQNQSYTERGIGPVYQVGPDVRILIIGQAPGAKVEQTGIPFNDQSGDRLREWMGITSDEFYNSGKVGNLPLDFYFPGKGKSGDLPPRKGFAEKWHPKMLADMPKVSLIILVGAYAQRFYLPIKKSETMTAVIKRSQEFEPKFMPIVHPSPRNNIWLRKNPWFEADIVPRLQARVRELMNEK